MSTVTTVHRIINIIIIILIIAERRREGELSKGHGLE